MKENNRSFYNLSKESAFIIRRQGENRIKGKSCKLTLKIECSSKHGLIKYFLMYIKSLNCFGNHSAPKPYPVWNRVIQKTTNNLV